MIGKARHWLLAALMLGKGPDLVAQLDTTAMGGAEDLELEQDSMMEAPVDELLEEVLPVFELPAGSIYKDWNTDLIFSKGTLPADTVMLKLAYESCDHSIPVRGGITSPFGPRRGRMHYGTDIKLRTGDAVASAFEGTVRISKYHGQYGNVVVVRHANGLETLYGHLSQRMVEVGDHVEAGDVLGLGGSTGRSTGSHLHFETRYLGSPIDPQSLFNVESGLLHADSFAVHPGIFAASERAKAAARSAAKSTKFHKVRKGETLSAISRKYRVSVARLCRMNRISAKSTLRVGQRVKYR